MKKPYTEISATGPLMSGRLLLVSGAAAGVFLLAGLLLEWLGVPLPPALLGAALYYALFGIVAGWYLASIQSARRRSEEDESST